MEDEFTEKMHSELWVPPEVDRLHRLDTAVMVMEHMDAYTIERVADMYEVTVEEIQERLSKKEKPPEEVKKNNI